MAVKEALSEGILYWDRGHHRFTSLIGMAWGLPKCIMLDLSLPDTDCLEAGRLIRQNPKTHSTPIIAVTTGAFLKAEHGEIATNRANTAMSP